MKIYIYLVVLAGGLCLLSCDRDEFLDITPKGLIIPTKASDYRLMLDQVDSQGAANGFYNCIDDDTYLSDELKITDDDALVGPTRYSESDINNYLWKDNSAINSEHVDGDWNRMYNQIFNSNIIINGLVDAEGTAAEIAQLDAEARVHRAYAYLLLVNMYAKHYDPTTANSDLGIPLRDDERLDGSLVRATVQETYDFILNDLSESFINALPDISEKKIRPSKASAYAILARTYLYMGNFDLALDFADRSLGLYNTVTDLTTLPASPFSFLSPDLVDLPAYHETAELLLAKGRVSVGFRPQELSDAFLALFELTNDVRYKGIFARDFVPPFQIVVAYDVQLEAGLRLTGPTVPEMMLTKAECLARNGDITGAIDLLNELRVYRLTTPTDLSYPATADEALTIVKQERAREFILKGYRWFDIKRYNAYDNANITLTKTYKGETVSLTPGDNRWVRPINRRLNEMNPELELNPQ